MLHPLAKEILTKIREAVKEFGTYSYEDKGPYEVMDVGELEAKLRELPADEMKIVFNEVGQTKLGAIFTEYVYEILVDSMEESVRSLSSAEILKNAKDNPLPLP